jgi:pilus assembly protein CpaF
MVSIRDLVRNSLRMRPDRIIVGECRGGEALDMLQAMNTGHEGSLTTVHANSPDDALARLETLASMSEVEIPFHAIRDQVNSAIDVIVQLNRQADGSRRVVETAFVASRRQEDFKLLPLVTWDNLHFDPETSRRGRFVVHPVPELLRQRLAEANVPLPQFMRSVS